MLLDVCLLDHCLTNNLIKPKAYNQAGFTDIKRNYLSQK